MPIISALDRTLLWAVQDGAAVIETGRTLPGETTLTGEWRQLLNAADEPAFLAAVAGKAGAYNPLPGVGEWVEAGAIYGYGGGLVIVRQSHARMDYAPEDTPALFSVYREDAADVLEWVANERVEVGTRRTYAGKTWQAIQAHVTLASWAPDITPALWVEVIETPTYPEWVAPTGAHDAYNTGDRVVFEGNVHESLIDANVWSPTAYPQGWLLIGPA